MKRRLLLLAIAGFSTALFAQQPPPYTAAIVMEPTTGRVLFEQNADQPLPTASMTKMMTLLIVLDNIKEGTLTWDTPLTVSALASKMGGSQVYLKHGETFRVRDLVAATMVHSANDAAMTLAEHVGGTGEAFVKLMNRRAQSLGLKNTQYYSPHGLPGEGDPDDLMSPRDLAILGRELMKSPQMRELATTQQMPFRGGLFIMYNPNHLLKIYPNATGIKTGYHVKAGFCVTGSARRGNMDLIAVVMGSKQKKDNFQSAANLLTEAFNSFKMVEPVRKGQQLPQPVAVEGASVDTVAAVAGDAARALVKQGEDQAIETEVTSTNATAPIRQGQQIGWVVLKQQGREVAKVPALAAVSVEEAPWYQKLFERLWPF